MNYINKTIQNPQNLQIIEIDINKCVSYIYLSCFVEDYTYTIKVCEDNLTNEIITLFAVSEGESMKEIKIFKHINKLILKFEKYTQMFPTPTGNFGIGDVFSILVTYE
jgi:hypothetical protein